MTRMKQQTDSARLWKPPLPGIELFEARLKQHRFGKHFHAAYTIGLNESGQGCSLHKGENRYLCPGYFNLINPGDIHTGQVAAKETDWAFRNIYLEKTELDRLLPQLAWSKRQSPYFKVPAASNTSLRTLFYELFAALADTAPIARLTQQSLLLEFLTALFAHYSETNVEIKSPQSESKAVAQIRLYLESHYAEAIALNDLARLVNLNPHYLIRCFRQQVGCPPHQYQRHCQLTGAKRALETPRAIAQIAADHGFYDQSHLNREFKRTFGVTPGQYQAHNAHRSW